jgi:membrane-bound ClpP family serine protease
MGLGGGFGLWALGTAFIGVILFFAVDMLVIWIHVECGDQLIMGVTGIILMAFGLLSVYESHTDIPFTNLNQLWAAALFSYGCTLLHREQIARTEIED